ncbi:EF-hand domain-containing protein D2 [Echinops telfairi]|uniref:EF-hand domain-containing protein D2 n=2 Tax=Eutheria TaxID=9347 RepID=A0ABM1VMK1_ECHTE|nr:EF-hand domain-containing protein D2 [Echinops telfairi]
MCYCDSDPSSGSEATCTVDLELPSPPSASAEQTCSDDLWATWMPGDQQVTRPDPYLMALGSADDELSAKLLRRADLNQGIGEPQSPSRRVFNPYTEFKEFSRKQIKDMEKMFKQYDAGRDGFIDLMELKLMMEKLGAPQTHLGLKNMIKEVDEDFDSKLSFREFLLIFRKAAAGELQEDSGLHVLARLSEIDVSTEGVKGAKSFFEAKVQAINVSSRFEEEIKAEQEERKKQAEELKQRKAAFKELQSTFK